jgi:hypothetical protein
MREYPSLARWLSETLAVLEEKKNGKYQQTNT